MRKETKQRKVDLDEQKKNRQILKIERMIKIAQKLKQEELQGKKNAAVVRFWETCLRYSIGNLTVVPVVIAALAEHGLLPAALANMPDLLKVLMPSINGLAIPVVLTGVEYGLRKTLGFKQHPQFLNKKPEIYNVVPMAVPVVNWFFPTLSVKEAMAYVMLAVSAQMLTAALDVKAPDSPEAIGMSSIYSQWKSIIFFQVFFILFFSRGPLALKSVGETMWGAMSDVIWRNRRYTAAADDVEEEKIKQLLADADADDVILFEK